MASPYRLSFTAGSLLINETQKIAQLYLELHNWDKVLAAQLNQNFLQKSKVASSKRQLREIKFRLQNLTDACLNYLPQAPLDDQIAIIILACFKTYTFIYEFILEVIKPKLDVFDDILRDSDYQLFFETKSGSHPELFELSDSTKAKIRQVLYRILAEGRMLESVKSKKITRPMVSSKVIELIQQDDPKWLAAFLIQP